MRLVLTGLAVLGFTAVLAADTVYLTPPHAPTIVYTPPQVQHVPATFRTGPGGIVYRPAQVVYRTPQVVINEPVRRHGVVYQQTTVATSPWHVDTYRTPVYRPVYRPVYQPVYQPVHQPVYHHHSHHYRRHHSWLPLLHLLPRVNLHIDL